MTPTEIDALPDAELVAAVAVRVLGWDEWTMKFVIDRYRTTTGDTRRVWMPLESWDDCFMVVDAMRDKGCPYLFRDDDGTGACIEFSEAYEDVYNRDPIAERRAIMRTALKAMEATT